MQTFFKRYFKPLFVSVVGAQFGQNLGQPHGAHGVCMALLHCPAPGTGHFGHVLGLAERLGCNGRRSMGIVAGKR